MSVFCLILAPRGRTVAADEVSRLLDPVRSVALCVRCVWVEDNFGVGLLHYSPGAPADPESYPHQALGGRLVLAADVRLDARQALMAELAFPASERNPASDEDLVLAAYLRWGRDCPRHLLGDFAFVIYDRQTFELFGAADALGSRRLFFGELETGGIVIASEEACLIAAPGLAENWSEVALACWIMGKPLRQLSLFERIGVVAGGQEFLSKAGSTVVREWWPAEATRDIRYRRLDEYAEHYRSLLQLAVSDRMPTGAVLCELSGGLDSSTVTAAAVQAAAGRSQVAALSHLYPGYVADDERAAIDATRAFLGLSDWHGVIDPPSLGQPWLDFAPRRESPCTFKSRLRDEAVALAVKLGCTVILNGFGGDEHTQGNPGFAATARVAHGDPGIIADWQNTSRRTGMSLGTLAWERLAKPAARRLLPQGLVREIEVRRVIRACLPPWLWRNRELLAQIFERYRSDTYLAGQDPYARSIILMFRRSSNLVALDAYRWSGRPYGVDVRTPFFDLRITDFVLGTPPDLWYRDGYSKYLVRKAFRGQLPESVLARGKALYSGLGQSRWETHHRAFLAEIESARARADTGSALARLLPATRNDLESVDQYNVIYTASLARWSNSRVNSMRGVTE